VFTLHVLVGTGIGFVAGAFTPSIMRKIRGLWVKETQIIKKDLVSIATDVKSKL
jgi:hypothetical protein